MTVNKDIIAGIKSALSRGYSIDEAMLSFLNAGYKREEVEEAAHSLQGLVLSQASPDLKPEIIWPGEKEAPVSKPDMSPKKTVPETPQNKSAAQKPVQSTVAEAPLPNIKPISKPEIKERIVPIAVPVQTSASINRVSAYNSYSKKIKVITTILIALLILLLGILGIMYAFRSQIISFFNSLFSNA